MYERICRICNKMFVTNIHNKYTCSDECARRWRNSRPKKRIAAIKYTTHKRRPPEHPIEYYTQYAMEHHISYGKAVAELETIPATRKKSNSHR